jgi:hypothetical protein
MITAIFTLAGCDNGSTSDSGNDPQTVTYSGKSGANTYTLTITENTVNRAVYTPQGGDSYELTLTPGNKKSSGEVLSYNAETFSLKPSHDPGTTFTTTVEGNHLVSITETTWPDGLKIIEVNLDPVDSGSGSGGNGFTVTGYTAPSEATIVLHARTDIIADPTILVYGSPGWGTIQAGGRVNFFPNTTLSGTYWIYILDEYPGEAKLYRSNSQVIITNGSGSVTWSAFSIVWQQ